MLARCANQGTKSKCIQAHLGAKGPTTCSWHVILLQNIPSEAQKSDIQDEIIIASQGCAIPVKVCCSVPRPNIVLQGDLNFAMVPSGSSVSTEAILKNEGAIAGSWTAAIDGDLPVNVSPTSGTLEPGAEEKLTVSLRDVEAGQATADLVITTTGHTPPLRAAVHMTSVNVSLDVLDSNGRLATEVCCRDH
jgi:hypothetical protein